MLHMYQGEVFLRHRLITTANIPVIQMTHSDKMARNGHKSVKTRENNILETKKAGGSGFACVEDHHYD